jgi:hypothetical protein
MQKYADMGASIEGEKILIDSRKIDMRKQIRLPNGLKYWKYKCSKRSDAEIIEELNPKVFVLNQQSFLYKGDCISADIIEVLCKNRLKVKKMSNTTSTHGSQNTESKGYTFAAILKPFRAYLVANQHQLEY